MSTTNVDIDKVRTWCDEVFPDRIKWTGENGVTRSPFPGHKHGDKNASFTISLESRWWWDKALGTNGPLSQLCEEFGWPDDPGKPDHTPASSYTPPRREEPQSDRNREIARRLWATAEPAPQDHAYLVKKEIPAYGCRVVTEGSNGTPRGTLLVPAFDLKTGELSSICRVAPGPDKSGKWPPKKLLGSVTGAAWTVGSSTDHGPVILAEGAATAGSIKRFVDGAALVACTFSSANLPHIANKMMELYPEREIVIAADNDEPGHNAADNCPPGCLKAFPPTEGRDWNDEATMQGIDRARELFTGKLERARRAQTVRSFGLDLIGDLDYHEPDFLVHGLIESECLGDLFGESGHGKSFIAMDLAASVATGTPFHGRATKKGPVIYLAGEGHNGLINRAKAWSRHRGVSLKGVPLALSKGAPVSFFTGLGSALDVIEEFADRHGSPRLIVVDTVARHFTGGDENSNSDMSVFANTADMLKARYGATVLLIHHSGHGDKDRGRGASALKGALDCEFKAEQSGDIIRLKATKMKDAPKPEPLTFRFEDVEIARSRRTGDPITTPVLVEVKAAGRPSKPLTGQQKMGLESYRIAAEEAGLLDEYGRFAGLHRDAWRDQFYKTSTADSTDAKRKSFQRVRSALVQLGWLRVEDDTYFPDGPNAIERESFTKVLSAKGEIPQDKQRDTDNVPGENDVPETQSAAQTTNMKIKSEVNKERDGRDICETLSLLSQPQGTEGAGRTGHPPLGVSHVPPVQPDMNIKQGALTQELDSSLRGKEVQVEETGGLL